MLGCPGRFAWPSFLALPLRHLGLGLTLSVSACAPSLSPRSSNKIQHLQVDSPTTVVSADRVTDVETLLVEAQLELESGRYAKAAESFQLVVKVAQKPDERLRGLWGWGTAIDAAGHPNKALGIYDRYVAEAPKGAKRDEILVRQVRVLTFLEEYQRAASLAGQVSTKQSSLAQIAMLSSMALFALSQEREADAELAIGRARSIVEEEGFDRLGVLPRDVAALYFALGELRRKKAEAVVFDPTPQDFRAALEERCQWILDAQSAYSQAMRAKDAHWSAMAGFSVGRLYQDLHQELTNMPRPSTATSVQKRELFDGALRLRYSILLTKAASMLRATLGLRNKDQAQGVWVHRVEDALSEIEAAEQAEEHAIASLPYSRQQLQQALDDLAARAKSQVGQN